MRDFHPQNLLAERGRVTAVLDWPNVLVAEPECDVAATLVILRLTPVGLFPVPAALRLLVAALRPLMVARHLARYRRARPLVASRLAYYEAAACMPGPGASGGGARGGDDEPARRLGVRRAPRRPIRAGQRRAGGAAAAAPVTVLPFRGKRPPGFRRGP